MGRILHLLTEALYSISHTTERVHSSCHQLLCMPTRTNQIGEYNTQHTVVWDLWFKITLTTLVLKLCSQSQEDNDLVDYKHHIVLQNFTYCIYTDLLEQVSTVQHGTAWLWQTCRITGKTKPCQSASCQSDLISIVTPSDAGMVLYGLPQMKQ